MTAVELCVELIRLRTDAPHPTGAAIDCCLAALAPAGFVLRKRLETAPGIEHALLERDGEDPSLLLDSHLDVVPVADAAQWTHDPFIGEIAGGAIWGRGAVDDKGPLAAAIMALRAVRGKRRVLLSLTGDEEVSMVGAQCWLELPEVRAAAQIIVLEPTELKPIFAHKGNTRLRVDLHGKAAHASRPWEGHNIIEDKVRLIPAIAAWFAAAWGNQRHPGMGEEPPTLVATRELTPNTAYNVVPAEGSIWYNFRSLPGMNDADAVLVEAIEQEISRLGIDASVEIEFSHPPFITPADAPLIRTLEGSNGISAGYVTYGTHAGFYCQYCPQVAVFGPGSIRQAHIADEFITIADLEAGKKALTQVLAELFE